MPADNFSCEIKAQVERITYYNEENHYTIAKVKTEGRSSLVTIVGTLYSVVPGEVLRLKGDWGTHPRYGEQFRVASYETLLPATVKGIERYLGSGMIKGIGPVMAKRLAAAFGDATLDVIDASVDRLREVPGIGDKRIDMIRTAWDEQKEVRNVMIFLQGNGVSPAYAAKIYRYYGNDAVRLVRENPFRLATDIFGIGFVTADAIAEKMGIGKDAPLRIEAGILYVLGQLADEGNIFFPAAGLIERSREVLGASRESIPAALQSLVSQNKIVIEDPPAAVPGAASYEGGVVYLASLNASEKGIAESLAELAAYPRQLGLLDIAETLAEVEKKQGIAFSERQVGAVRASVEKKVLVITGGPGTGKTTIIRGIIGVAQKMGHRVLLAAPTGRASKRMFEATGLEARTIHRLLEYTPGSSPDSGFKRNESNRLEADIIIIDEASMIDVPLMHHLLKAVPLAATLVLVGDVDQLPSVGPGSVLRDIIRSGSVGTVRLNEIFRQSTRSMIVVNAHRINSGTMPVFESQEGQGRDFVFVDLEDPEDVVRRIVDLTSTIIPSRFGFHPLRDIQVVTPMHRGTAGVANLNAQLQAFLNTNKQTLSRGGRTFKAGDKVLQTRNNYDKDVYNGDIGRVAAIDPEVQELTVDFEGRKVSYDFRDLDELILAYAISVHKSQGSEYPVVIMPVLTQHYMLLQRNLIYTAITRGKKLVYLVGTKKALSIAIRNDRPYKRYSLLADRLRASIKRPDPGR